MLGTIADTARWAAFYRAVESERADALFVDSFARRLSGPLGAGVAGAMPHADRYSWAAVLRTYLVDQLLVRALESGADMVVNLAAGLDTRPYRLALPSSLVWIEVDLPEMLADKTAALAGDRPMCSLERIGADLRVADRRRDLFNALSSRGRRSIVITEGLLIYLTAEEVAALASDLAAAPAFREWLLDVQLPGLVRVLQSAMGRQMEAARAPFRFSPGDGPAFFQRFGWHAADVRSIADAAVCMGRAPKELAAHGRGPRRVDGLVCRFTRDPAPD